MQGFCTGTDKSLVGCILSLIWWGCSHDPCMHVCTVMLLVCLNDKMNVCYAKVQVQVPNDTLYELLDANSLV
jgi:hypothetical protein